MWCNQIFSLINEDGIIQNIIVADNYTIANQFATDMYGELAIAVDTTQYPLGIGYKYIDGLFYDETGINEILRNLTADEEAKLAVQKVEALNTQINPTIDIENCTIDELKFWQIKLSKNNLKVYLELNPIFSTCHTADGAYYSITEDKQKYLTQMIMMSQLAIQGNIEYQPSWNSTGQPCTYDWTILELQQLAFEIENIVRPSISKQQYIESQINACETKEAILAISLEIQEVENEITI